MVNIRDKWGMTPIRYCLSTDYDEIADVLMQKDPDTADSQDKYGTSVLHAAAEEGSEKFMRLLLRMGADPNITTDFGVTPLMSLMSAKSVTNYFILMNILIDAGADVLVQDLRDKRTALHVSMGNIK
jgi:ankyrin repeat protein